MLESFAKADCVMFSGGDQSKIASVIGGTKLHKLILEKFQNENFVIAGTSAGAMAMAHEMIAGGSSTESLLKGAVVMRKGLGLMPELIIDTHFIRRGRFGRLAEAVAIHPKLIGIGLAEDTGLIIKNGESFKVIGSGMVIVLEASQLTHNAHGQLKVGTAMSMSNLTTHILANGDKFTLSGRTIEILPIHEKFV
jgi:cyanophycinase